MNNPIFVSYIDDPRINLEMALAFEKIEDDFWEEGETEFLEKTLSDIQSIQDVEVLFPITTTHELRNRLREILCYTKCKNYDNFSHNDFLRAVFKSSLRFVEERITFTSPHFGKYGNPELQMVLQTLRQVTRTHAQEFLGRIIGYDYAKLNSDDFSVLEKRMSSFISGVIWTQTNVGSSVYSEAKNKSQNIMNLINIENNSYIFINRLKRNFKYVQAVVIEKDGKNIQNEKIVEGLFRVDNKDSTPIKNEEHSMKIDLSNEHDIVFRLTQLAQNDKIFSKNGLYNISAKTLQNMEFLSENSFIIQVDDVKYKLNFKDDLNIKLEA